MKLVKRKTSIKHDYYHVVTSVYPKIIDSIDCILYSFKENKDASMHFVDYFKKGHREIHTVVNYEISCNLVNDLLSDLFLSLTRFDRKSYSFQIPELFYNYHAVHYYHQIKAMIIRLVNNNYSSEKIIEYLIKYEINRHENNECYCGENHDLLESDKLRELLAKILDYYYSVNNNYFSENIMNHQSQYRYLN